MWGVGSWQESCQRLGTSTEHETQCPVTIYSGANVTLLIWGNAILIRRCGFDSPTSREMLLHFSVVLVLPRYWNAPLSHTQKELLQGKLMSYLVEKNERMLYEKNKNTFQENIEWEENFGVLFVRFCFPAWVGRARFCRPTWPPPIVCSLLLSSIIVFFLLQIYYFLFYPFIFPSCY